MANLLNKNKGATGEQMTGTNQSIDNIKESL